MDTMVDEQKVVALLWGAVDELNLQLRRDQRLAKRPEERLTGEGGRLDSLGLLNLLVLAEQRIEAEFGINVMLADDRNLGDPSGPFATLGSLAQHIRRVVEEKLH